jgi:glucan phosphoethanolaminetransferase (alkaline phosphatase superfamily)
MIQRIQSLYLSLTIILSFLFLNGSFLNFIDPTGSMIKITFTQIIRETSTADPELLAKIFPLPLLIIVISALSFIIIILFKNRNLQMWLVKFLIVLVIVLIIISGVYANNIITKYDSHIIPGFKMVIPILQLIFSVLAYRGIKKDDNLVKSYDRLR